MGFGGTSSTASRSHITDSGTMASEIDKIMAKIENNNKILAELDKSRATIGKLLQIYVY